MASLAFKLYSFPLTVTSAVPAVNFPLKVTGSFERTTQVAWALIPNPKGFFPLLVSPALKVTTLEVYKDKAKVAHKRTMTMVLILDEKTSF